MDTKTHQDIEMLALRRYPSKSSDTKYDQLAVIGCRKGFVEGYEKCQSDFEAENEAELNAIRNLAVDVRNYLDQESVCRTAYNSYYADERLRSSIDHIQNEHSELKACEDKVRADLKAMGVIK